MPISKPTIFAIFNWFSELASIWTFLNVSVICRFKNANERNYLNIIEKTFGVTTNSLEDRWFIFKINLWLKQFYKYKKRCQGHEFDVYKYREKKFLNLMRICCTFFIILWHKKISYFPRFSKYSRQNASRNPSDEKKNQITRILQPPKAFRMCWTKTFFNWRFRGPEIYNVFKLFSHPFCSFCSISHFYLAKTTRVPSYNILYNTTVHIIIYLPHRHCYR